jgi:cytochrome c oxidase cbb3-type subunit I/II
MKNAKTVALVAGIFFISMAIFIQGLMPFILKESTLKKVTRTVRTRLGLLEEVQGRTMPYPELVARGRRIYIREGCWYCHSMYVRPVAGEQRRWGPVSQVGEYAYDIPHTFGTRRIGPDITREGGKHGDDWHRAHFFDARLMVPESIMPKFPWLYKKYEKKEEAKQQEGGQAGEALDHQHVLPVESNYVPNADGEALIAFVQFLGTQRGKWRDNFPSQIIETGSATIQTAGSLEHGKAVYGLRCAGCHGEKGDGKGPAARFFVKAKPRDFTAGSYKFRSTPTGSLPLDSDIYRTITMGVMGTAMPPWYELPEEDRWDVVQYVKTFSDEFKESVPEPPVYVPKAPRPTKEMLSKGEETYEKLGCWACHGKDGKGDGPAAGGLTDDSGNKILPTDFTQGVFKVGPRPEDIFRTFMTGLNGTPMPSYKSFLSSEQDAWDLAYYVLSFSADAPEK